MGLEMSGNDWRSKDMVIIIRNSMKKWKTVLTSGGKDLGEVDVKRGIFQDDSLSPLLFTVIMLPIDSGFEEDERWI